MAFNQICNMSAPPRSIIDIDIKPNGTIVLFDLKKCLDEYRKMQDKNICDFEKELKEYIKENPNWMIDVHPISIYMISYKIAVQKLFPIERECTDVNLCLYIFGKTVNDIYIPNRKWSESYIKNRKLYFNQNEVFNV